MFLYTSSALGELITTKRLIEANSANLESAYNNNITAASINLWIGVYSATCYNVSHWILAVQYWSLSMKLEAMLNGQNIKTFTTRIRWYFLAGLLLNISTGVTIILRPYYRKKYPNLKYWRDWLNLAAAAVSNIMLIDALRRLRKIVKGVFAVDTWQMILHLSAYLLVFFSGVILLSLDYGFLGSI